MSESGVKVPVDFVLPARIVSKADISRLVSEVEWVDNELTAASVRAKVGAEEQPKPPISESLSEFLEQNKLGIEDGHSRASLIKSLRELKDDLPVIHMTFAVPADSESLQKLTEYVRSSIHPQALLSIGLQPALVAGVHLRTPNRIHDFSMRTMLTQQHGVLVKELESLRGNQ